jgi:serine/threonine protein phosphatase PrpC
LDNPASERAIQWLSSQAKTLSLLARTGKLTARHLRSLVQDEQRLDDSWSRATWLRLLKRMANKIEIDPALFEGRLAELYLEASLACDSPAEKLGMLRWARRYGYKKRGEYYRLNTVVSEMIREATGLDECVRLVALSDSKVALGPRRSSLKHNLDASHAYGATLGRNTVLLEISKGAEGSFRTSNAGWDIAGVTSANSKRTNEDAVGCALTDGVPLIVVADGCGHSPGAEAASSIAVRSFPMAYAMTGSFQLAAELTSTAIRLMNRRRGLSASTTLTAVSLNGDLIQFVSLGDSPYIVIGRMGEIRRATYTKESRLTLGGERLGDSVTGSGYFIGDVILCPPSVIGEIDSSNRFIIGSDGVIVEESDRGIKTLTDILISSRSKPDAIVKDLLIAVSEAQATGIINPDNLTAVVGRRSDNC